MFRNKRRLWLTLAQIFIFIILFSVHYNGLLKIPALHANPMIILAYLATFSMFASELQSAIVGLLVGIFADAFSSTFSCFHTILFFVLATVISVLMHYILNNNFRTAIMIAILSSSCYYVLRWLFCYAFSETVHDSASYIMQYGLPSVIYTSLFIIPFYYFQKKIFLLKNT